MESQRMANTISERRQFPRVANVFPIEVAFGEGSDALIGRTMDISETGSKLLLKSPFPIPTTIGLTLNLSPYSAQKEIDADIVWGKALPKQNRFLYGVRFPPQEDTALKEILCEINEEALQNFLGIRLPTHIRKECRARYLCDKFDQREIMNIIDFKPPFLKVNKIAILGSVNDDVVKKTALGMGVITPADTDGHYNDTIFLALCGWLMASVSSIHLAVLFPSSAPQVIEANHVKPLKLVSQPNAIWKPSSQGTVFLVESHIERRKLQLFVMRTRITLGTIQFGVIEELKLVLTDRKSIFLARDFPAA